MLAFLESNTFSLAWGVWHFNNLNGHNTLFLTGTRMSLFLLCNWEYFFAYARWWSAGHHVRAMCWLCASYLPLQFCHHLFRRNVEQLNNVCHQRSMKHALVDRIAAENCPCTVPLNCLAHEYYSVFTPDWFSTMPDNKWYNERERVDWMDVKNKRRY